jgi:hypothetical protein
MSNLLKTAMVEPIEANRERIKSVVRRKYLKEADLSLKTSAHEVYLSVLGAA